MLERSVRWLIVNLDMDADAAETIRDNRKKINDLIATFSDVVSGEDHLDFQKYLDQLRNQGVEEEAASHLAKLQFFDQLLVIVQVAQDTHSELTLAAEIYYEIADRFKVRYLMKHIREVVHNSRWEERAANTLLEDLNRHLYSLSRTKLLAIQEGNDLKIYSRDYRLFVSLIDDIQAEDVVSVAGLSVAVRQMAILAEKVRVEVKAKI